MPQIAQVDPRLFNIGGAIADGVSSGVGVAGRLQDIAASRAALDAQEEARAYEMSRRPYREQLSDIQLETAGLGLEQQRAQQRLTDLAMPRKEIEARQPVVLEENTFIDYDEEGNLVEFKRQKKQDPTTNEIILAPRIYNKTLKTKDQLAADKVLNAAKAQSLQALAESRTNKDPKFESDLIQKRLEQAAMDGDDDEVAYWRARQARLNALPGQLNPGTTFDRGTEKMGLGAGFTKNQIASLATTQAGLNAMRKLDTVNTLMKAEKEFNIPELALTPEEQSAIDAVRNQSTTGKVPVINTKQEYDRLPAGSTYVDAADGKQYVKGNK